SSNDLFVDTYSMYEVYNGVVLGKPVISRWVNFSGNCIPASCFLNVKIGYSLRDFMEQLGDFVHQPAMVVINGMLCGDTISKMNVPITKSVKSVEFISKANFTDFQIYNCVNCGNCRAACPMNLAPDLLYKNLVNRKSNIDTEIKIAQICIECGLCNTVCPARLPICQTISFLKNNKNDNTAKSTKNNTTDVIENNNPTDDKVDSQPINL
ncbi:MAG: 4Fe-4S dicluster domain-containing protein, partial [Treponema sp.]|nr:4Fe-4S dicluster domain-containing protein [Treponema sp.]